MDTITDQIADALRSTLQDMTDPDQAAFVEACEDLLAEYNAAKGYKGPACGHSACRQNYIDTGSTECVQSPEPIDGAFTNHNLYLRAYTGKLVRVVAMFPTAGDHAPIMDEPANAYMAEHPGVGLLAIVNGMALLAENTDEGRAPQDIEAKARRIAACLAACAHIPTDTLEGAGFAKLDGDPLYELVPEASR